MSDPQTYATDAREASHLLTFVALELWSRTLPGRGDSARYQRHLACYPNGQELTEIADQAVLKIAKDHAIGTDVARILAAKKLFDQVDRLKAEAAAVAPADAPSKSLRSKRALTKVEAAVGRIVTDELAQFAGRDPAVVQNWQQKVFAAFPTLNPRPILPLQQLPAESVPTTTALLPVRTPQIEQPLVPPMRDLPQAFPYPLASSDIETRMRMRWDHVLAWKKRKPVGTVEKNSAHLRSTLTIIAETIIDQADPQRRVIPLVERPAVMSGRPGIVALFTHAQQEIGRLAQDKELRSWAVASQLNLNDPRQSQRLTEIAGHHLWLTAWDQALYPAQELRRPLTAAARTKTTTRIMNAALTRVRDEKAEIFAQLLIPPPPPPHLTL
jgi:hypothetical protein